MHEVRVESLDGIKLTGGELWLSVNAGSLNLIFPREVWQELLSGIPDAEEPRPEELAELDWIRRRLAEHARERSFATVLEDVACGEDAGLRYHLVLRSSEPFAVTTGYHFAPVIGRDLAGRIEEALREDRFVEQAYLVGATAEPRAFSIGDENLKALCVRGRRSSTSRFEMSPELWKVLSERPGWSNVKTVPPDGRE
ncbi:hypothetical protein Rxycam_03127 [Rubrobacter xylanophilus DSM 9941]|uniref:hypothetical protein n=1 Tax=Rubrobacter xylanophilus TaxID=49319 RepID=UPI001C63E2BE|nr:hypothetical protein [Rubrobacter xylanophilus]QYJ17285.1 hypothetical protein Rxycam_03127 [Rubrobacter xylanophilus DSM 9941]